MRVRVHVYERSFPEEPNNVFSVGATAVDTAFDTGRRTRRWHEERGSAARQRRASGGVSDPRKLGAGPWSGGGRGGRSRPQMPRHCCLRPRSQDTGGEKRRPSDRGPNSLIAKNIAGSTRLAISSSCAPPSLPISAAKRGTTTPRPVVPPPFLDAEFVTGLPGERNLARRSLRS